MSKKLLLHMHQIRNFLDDRDDFYRTYFLKQESKDKDYYLFGRVMDYEIKHYYLNGGTNIFENPEFNKMDDEAQMIAVAMIEGYKKYYKGEYFHNYRVVNYRVPFHNFLIYASPDLEADDYDDNEWIIEIKTGTSDRIALNFQTMLYLWAKWKWNYRLPKGILKRILRKPTIKQKKKESTQDFNIRLMSDFEDRGEFYYLSKSEEITKEQILNFEKYLGEICKEMYAVMSSKNPYKFYKKTDTNWG